MTITDALSIYCTLGGAIGGLLRWGYPFLFKSKEKRSEYEELNPYIAIGIGAIIGYGISIFFGSDLKGVDGVDLIYIKKLGMLSALFTMSVIDKLDKLVMNRVNSYIQDKT